LSAGSIFIIRLKLGLTRIGSGRLTHGLLRQAVLLSLLNTAIFASAFFFLNRVKANIRAPDLASPIIRPKRRAVHIQPRLLSRRRQEPFGEIGIKEVAELVARIGARPEIRTSSSRA
jgi:hypothetical protein